MGVVTILLIGVGLAMDCLAVSLGIGAGQMARSFRPVFRLSFHFGLFQALMTLLGFVAGSSIARFIASIDHWVAFGLLIVVGGRMIRSGLNPEEETYRVDPTRGGSLVMLSVATSIDALAVGFSMALLKVNIALASLLIGLVSSVFCLGGLFIGCRLGARFGKRMEIVGGLILIAIGIRILVSHLMGL